MHPRPVLTLLVAALLVAAPKPPAGAATGGGGAGGVDQGDDTATLHVWVGVEDESGVLVPVVGPGSTPARHRRPVRRTVSPATFPEHAGPPYTGHPFCNPDGGDYDPGSGPWGWVFVVTTSDGRTGEVLDESWTCVAVDGAEATVAPSTPAVPEPPSVGELWAAVALPVPEAATSPAGRGVTGLATWLFASSPVDTVAVVVSLRGYTVTGTARLVGFRIDPGDAPVVDVPAPTTSGVPAAVHTYERKGTYRVQVYGVWEAAFTLTGPGVSTALPLDVPRAFARTSFDLRVVEIRSVLVR